MSIWANKIAARASVLDDWRNAYTPVTGEALYRLPGGGWQLLPGPYDLRRRLPAGERWSLWDRCSAITDWLNAAPIGATVQIVCGSRYKEERTWYTKRSYDWDGWEETACIS